MKPIKLTMSAFGPYATVAEVDFERFENEGVFLITGDTGAGKTTIFDGISYALYGLASGGKKRRDGKSFRSDFASMNNETYVEFVFRHRDRKYRITRNPDYERAKRKGSGTTKKSANAVLECLDTDEVISGVEKVDKKVKELIGLDQNQFSQTVMIAQGDFLKILNAKSEERKQLFQKLFHTGDYEWIQKQLKEKYDVAIKKLEQIKTSLEQEQSRIYIEPEFEECELIEELCSSDAHLLRLVPTLEKMISYQKKQHEIILAETEQLQKKVKEADAEYVRKEEGNKNLQRLAQLQEQWKALETKKEEIIQIQQELDAAKKAARLEPDEALMKRSSEDAFAERRRLEKQQLQLKSLSACLPQLEETWQKAEKEAESLEEIAKQLLDKEDAIVVREQYEQLSQKVVLIQKKMQDLLRDSQEKDLAYFHAKERYYSSQSGFLAQSLEPGKACPVCGSKEHPDPAKLQEGAVSKEDVEDAEEQRKRANDLLMENDKQMSQWKAAQDEQGKRLVQLGVDRDCDIQMLKQEMQALQEKKDRIRSQKEQSEKAYRKAAMDFEKTESLVAELSDSLIRKEQESLELEEVFHKKRMENGFVTMEQYMEAKRSAKDQQQMEREIVDYGKKAASLQDQIHDYQNKTADIELVDLSAFKAARDGLQSEFMVQTRKEREIEKNLAHNEEIFKFLESQYEKLEKQRQECAVVTDLYQVISGQKGGTQGKLTFEAYVQQYYFKEVIAAANKRLTVLTDGLFTLRCKPRAKNLRSQSGLDLDVLDRSTGMWRDVSTLSGGESFMASMALALGLSDIVQNQSGQIRLDSMFIDEGFGSLDETALQQAMNLLEKLADGNRLIGVISHVAELKERIDQKIIVRKTISGSEVTMVN